MGLSLKMIWTMSGAVDSLLLLLVRYSQKTTLVGHLQVEVVGVEAQDLLVEVEIQTLNQKEEMEILLCVLLL